MRSANHSMIKEARSTLNDLTIAQIDAPTASLGGEPIVCLLWQL